MHGMPAATVLFVILESNRNLRPCAQAQETS